MVDSPTCVLQYLEKIRGAFLNFSRYVKFCDLGWGAKRALGRFHITLTVLLTITRDRMKILQNRNHQCVRLVSALQMTCDMTPFMTPGSPRDLDLRSNFKLAFRGQKDHHSTRLDERNTMVQRLCLYLYYMKSY